MGAEIDRLEVRVEAQAGKANQQLELLIRRLDRVSSSLMAVNSRGLATMGAGFNKLANAMNNFANNTKTTDFSRLARNIASLNQIDVSKFSSIASGMRQFSSSLGSIENISGNAQQVAQVAKDISKLGGVNVQRAITNLPQLATALSSFMTVMSKAPIVSQDIIRMTNALASLASQGGKVGTATRTVSNALDTQNNSIARNTKRVNGLASALGKLYQKYFWIRRIASKVWDSTESSMDFLETVNYFEVAMRDIGDSAAAQWKENGYSSAEAYAESFSERAKQLTEKMTGYSIDKDGNATYLGAKNLGMDPEKVMQYQATYAQISSSIGVAEESALNFSKALTMLGADWASLRNLSFDQAWEKFASALAGQSRAVRSLGIDITNATLQEYAYKHGLEMAVSEMNQATKAQLRLLAILDQSQVAFGDLANTIQSPANQIRMLQQNVGNLGRVFGNLFMPVLQKTLPFINGTVIALQNLFSWIGNLLGIKFESINSSMGGMSEEMSDLVGGAEDFEDGLNGANNAAKKLKSNLQGFDELNVITTQDNSGSSGANIGGGSAILDDEIAKALADYEKVWNEAFDRMENKAQEYAAKIGKFLEPVKQIIEDFAIGDFFKAGQDTSNLVAGIFNFFAEAIDNVDWEKLGQNMGDYLAGIDWPSVIKSTVNFIWTGFEAASNLYVGAFNTAPFETSILTALGLMKFTGADKAIAKALKPHLEKIDMKGTVIQLVGVEVAFEGLKFASKNVWGQVGNKQELEEASRQVLGDFWGTLYANAVELFGGEYSLSEIIGALFKKDTWTDVADNWKSGFDILLEDFGNFGDSIKEWWNNTELVKEFSSAGDEIKESWDNLRYAFEKELPEFINTKIKPWFTKEKWAEIFNNIKLGLQEKWNAMVTWWNGTAIVKWWNQIKSWFSFSKWSTAFENIKTTFVNIWNSAIDAVKGLWNSFATWLNNKLTFTMPQVDIAGYKFGGNTIKLVNLPTYEIGGFPEDGLFMANHNELVGEFSNGKTAVANDYQIVSGIKEGVKEAVSEILAPYLADIAENTRETANKNFSINSKDIHSAVVRENNMAIRRNHKNPLLT